MEGAWVKTGGRVSLEGAYVRIDKGLSLEHWYKLEGAKVRIVRL